MKTLIRHCRSRWLILTVVAVALLFSQTSWADGLYGYGNYSGCQYSSCSISIMSNSTVSLDITPTASGKCTVQSDTVSVETDSSNGYTLTLAASSTNTNLQNGSAFIGRSGATLASPASLSPNAWGYRVDGVGSFGAGPTSAISNGSPSGTLFAGIRASNETADTLKITAVPANPPDATTVWYGVCANTNVTNGEYVAQVTYSAIAN